MLLNIGICQRNLVYLQSALGGNFIKSDLNIRQKRNSSLNLESYEMASTMLFYVESVFMFAILAFLFHLVTFIIMF